MCIIIRQPQTAEEFEQYYQLRWQLLRAPWGQPQGSEKDAIEDDCVHFTAMDNDKCIAVARLQFNPDNEAQVRYMAVSPPYEGKGIGRRLMAAMETQAGDRSHKKMILDARESALGFYKALGYEITGKSYLLFNEIQHYKMKKNL